MFNVLLVFVDFKANTVLFSGFFGDLELLNLDTVSVGNDPIPNTEYLFYKNNQLEYLSNNAFIGESIIYNTTGKMIKNLGSQPFMIGKNLIRVNHPLQRGIYLLSIKNTTSQSSFKFIVE